jgi:energy-coupling factor transport system ATP-binding protein
VTVKGQNTRDHAVAQLAEDVGMVFQDFEVQLFSTNTVLEVAFGPENFALPRDQIVERVAESLRYVGLEALKDRSPSTLSGGQKQKLTIASVLAIKPDVLVMDEPTSDLDPISTMGIFAITDQLRRHDGLTLVIIEHDTEEVLHADRIALLKDGAIVRCGPAHEILREVDLLEELGIMPLGIPLYFKKMGVDKLPLTVDEAVQQFHAYNWRIDKRRYQALLQRDAAQQAAYGDVIIRCTGLEHRYANGFQALQGIDLEIRQGEMIAIVGQNGSGKTTLAKHFNGLLMPSAGVVEVGGQLTATQSVFTLGQRVGYVFQNPDHQIFADTVFNEVAFALRLRGLSDAEIKQQVAESLSVVGLQGFEQADPAGLTKGDRQRVAVASVLAMQPEILILDEPTTGLDYREQRSMMDLIRQINQRGSTVIFVTHHMAVVAEYAHRVIVMKDGQVLLEGSTRQVLHQEADLRSASLRPPHLVSVANRLGQTMLSVDEMLACTSSAERTMMQHDNSLELSLD